MNRRAFLAASAAAATIAGTKTAAADGLPLGPLPEMRYPDVRIESADKKFFGTHFPAFAGTAGVERVATGFRWAEGPAFFREGNYLIFSDIPNNRMMRLLWDDNHLSVFREPSNNSNGNTSDPQGRLVTCEHRARRVTRTELDGTITVVADKYNGKRLNSPNDVVVASNGSIWFTDPTYGIGGNYEGLKQTQEQDKHYVFRIDGKTGEIKPVVDDFTQPNGICFSPDEKKLYIIDTGYTDGGPSHIRVFDCDIETGKLTNGKVFAEGFAPGITDGMRCDIDGNVWCSMGWADPKEDGVRCYSPSGDLLGKIHLPETCANLCFGGPLRNRLFVCGSTSVYALYVGTQGALKP
jgi:gluconolactonase